ncbi:hypothetical protein H4582DRAFT_2062047 [Lactarius indigo]|nr:hypothetical protein H4582DRAFT_2062047 [Lactarius indigo]
MLSRGCDDGRKYILGYPRFPPTISTSRDWGLMQGKGDWVTNYGYESIQFIPLFLATCNCRAFSRLYYNTPVGGTTCYKAEIAASLSGGVFLNYFHRASFQPQAAHPSFRTPANAGIKPLPGPSDFQIFPMGSRQALPGLNPWPYDSGPIALNDITVGLNMGL